MTNTNREKNTRTILGRIRCVGLLVCLLTALLAASCALAAEPVLPVEESRTDIIYSDGLRFVAGKAPAFQDGVWRMTIDTAATDWASVVAMNYNNSQEVMGPSFFLFADPAKTAEYVSTGYFGGIPEEEMKEFFDFWQSIEPEDSPGWQGDRQMERAAFDMGHYDPATGKFFPQATEAWDCLFVRFKYTDGTYENRWVRIEIAFSSTDPVDVPLPQVPAEDILPNFGGSTFEAQVSRGRIKYTNITDHPEEIRLQTAVRAPGSKDETASWKASYNSFDLATATDADGHLVACIENHLPVDGYYEDSSSFLVWRDAVGTIQAIQQLDISITHGKLLLWPEYVAALVPFESGDVQLSVAGGVDGLSVASDGKTIHLTIDSEKVVKAAARGVDPSAGELQVRVKAPSDAKYYSGGDTLTSATNIYGPDLAEEYYPNGSHKDFGDDKPVPVPGKWITLDPHAYMFGEEFSRPMGGTMKYFFSHPMSTEMGGEVQILRWFDANMDLIGENYLVFTYDPVPLITLQEVVEDESALPKHPNMPRAVVKGNWCKPYGKVSLKADRLPSSPQTFYYDLKLVAEDGTIVPVPQGETCDVYLPFPDGYTRETARELRITTAHYNDQGQLVEEGVYSVEKGNLELTPYGMRLRTGSFSPYVVSWEPAAPAPADPVTPAAPANVPKTGDSFPLGALLLLSCLSLLTAGWLIRGRKRA